MNYNEMIALALELPEVEESTSYGDPAIKRKGRLMFAFKDKGDTLAIKLDWETHDRLLSELPEIFYKTPHYDGWPWLLVRLELLGPELARDIVTASWEDAPNPNRVLPKQ